MKFRRVLVFILFFLAAAKTALSQFEGVEAAISVNDFNVTKISNRTQVSSEVGRSNGNSVFAQSDGGPPGGAVSLTIETDLVGPGIVRYWSREDLNYGEGEWELKERVFESGEAVVFGELVRWSLRRTIKVYIDDVSFQKGYVIGIDVESGQGDVAITPIETIGELVKYRLTANPDDGYGFLKWRFDDSARVVEGDEYSSIVEIWTDRNLEMMVHFGVEKDFIGCTGVMTIDEGALFGSSIEIGGEELFAAFSFQFSLEGPGLFSVLSADIDESIGIHKISIQNDAGESISVESYDLGDGVKKHTALVNSGDLTLSVSCDYTLGMRMGGFSFEPGFSPQLRILGGGEVDSNVSLPVEDPREKILLTAVPLEGWRFVCWEGDVFSRSSELEYEAGSEDLIVARFANEEVALGDISWNVTLGEGASIIVSEGNVYQEGPYGAQIEYWAVVEGPGKIEISSLGIAFTSNGSDFSYLEDGRFGAVLRPGRNIVRGVGEVLDQDEYSPTFGFGAVSLNNRISIDLETVGNGSISHDLDPSNLFIGDYINFSAKPAEGNVFLNWDRAIESTFEEVTLRVDKNDTVRANFGLPMDLGTASGYVSSNRLLEKKDDIYKIGLGTSEGAVYQFSESTRPSKIRLRARSTGMDEFQVAYFAKREEGESVFFESVNIGSDWSEVEFKSDDGVAIDELGIFLSGFIDPDSGAPVGGDVLVEFEVLELSCLLGNELNALGEVLVEPSKTSYRFGERVKFSYDPMPGVSVNFPGVDDVSASGEFELVVSKGGILSDLFEYTGLFPGGELGIDLGVDWIWSEVGIGMNMVPYLRGYADSDSVARFSVEGAGVFRVGVGCQEIEVYVDGVLYPKEIYNRFSEEVGDLEMMLPLGEGSHVIEVFFFSIGYCCTDNELPRDFCFESGFVLLNPRYERGYLLSSPGEEKEFSVSSGKNVFSYGESVIIEPVFKSFGGDELSFIDWGGLGESSRLEITIKDHTTVVPNYDSLFSKNGFDILSRGESRVKWFETNEEEIYFYVYGSTGLGVSSELFFETDRPATINFTGSYFSADPSALGYIEVYVDSERVFRESFVSSEEKEVDFTTLDEGVRVSLRFLSDGDVPFVYKGIRIDVDDEVWASLEFFDDDIQLDEDDSIVDIGDTLRVRYESDQDGAKGVVVFGGDEIQILDIEEAKGLRDSVEFKVLENCEIDVWGTRILRGESIAVAVRDSAQSFEEMVDSVLGLDGGSFSIGLFGERTPIPEVVIPILEDSLVRFWVYLDEGEKLSLGTVELNGQYAPEVTLEGLGSWHQVSWPLSGSARGLGLSGSEGIVDIEGLTVTGGYGVRYVTNGFGKVNEQGGRQSYLKGEELVLRAEAFSGTEAGWMTLDSEGGVDLEIVVGAVEEVLPWFTTTLEADGFKFALRGNQKGIRSDLEGALFFEADAEGPFDLEIRLDGPGVFLFRSSDLEGDDEAPQFELWLDGEKYDPVRLIGESEKFAVQIDSGVHSLRFGLANEENRDFLSDPYLSDFEYVAGYSVLVEADSLAGAFVYPKSLGLEIGDAVAVLALPNYGSNYEFSGALKRGESVSFNVNGNRLFEAYGVPEWDGRMLKVREEVPYRKLSFQLENPGPGVLKIPLGSHSGDFEVIGENVRLTFEYFYDNGWFLSVAVPSGCEEITVSSDAVYSIDPSRCEYHPGYGVFGFRTALQWSVVPEKIAYAPGEIVEILLDAPEAKSGVQSQRIEMLNHEFLPNDSFQEVEYDNRVYRTSLFGWRLDNHFNVDGTRFMVPGLSGTSSWMETTLVGTGIVDFSISPNSSRDYMRILCNGEIVKEGVFSGGRFRLLLPNGNNVLRIEYRGDYGGYFTFFNFEGIARGSIGEWIGTFGRMMEIGDTFSLTGSMDLDEDGVSLEEERRLGLNPFENDFFVSMGFREFENVDRLCAFIRYRKGVKESVSLDTWSEWFSRIPLLGRRYELVDLEYQLVSDDQWGVGWLVPIDQFLVRPVFIRSRLLVP